MEVGEAIGLDPIRRRNLEFGALLHDVGKVTIPKHIINKPGKLDAAEWAIVKTHTVEGQRMLDRVGGFMSDVGLIVRSHHERWDGCGYPDGLSGERIPLEARIVCCCDAWSAMTTTRSYRRRCRSPPRLLRCAAAPAPSSIPAWSTLSSNACCSQRPAPRRTTRPPSPHDLTRPGASARLYPPSAGACRPVRVSAQFA